MTRRERLMAIFYGDVPDRPAVKLWGCDPGRIIRHPEYAKVKELAMAETAVVASGRSPFSLYAGRHAGEFSRSSRSRTDSPDWDEVIHVIHTLEGDLEEICYVSNCGRPGYHKTYYLKEPDDIRKLLSLPYEPFPFSMEHVLEQEGIVGDGGIVMLSLDHAMYGLERLIGSENFALWSFEADELILEAIELFSDRIIAHVRDAIDTGFTGVFGWVGPELCIPPLMSPAHFDRYVGEFDRRLIDVIHDAGGRVWVHSHGKMGPVLERFRDMGVDVLNPIEPPPMGDVTLEEAFSRVGDSMGLEGNIETHDFMTEGVDVIRAKIHAALDAGNGRRFILCPSSGFSENVEPSVQEIENWLFYIREGVRYASEMAR